MLYAFEDREPKLLGDNYFIADSADVIGSVIIHNNVSILPHAVIRADNEVIEIGEGSNVQDGALLHTDPGIPMRVGKGVTIAHRAMLHGCTIGDHSVIAIGAIVMNNAIIGKNCIIGANALILENQKIPDGSLVIGSPGKVKSQLSQKQIEEMQGYAKHYIEKIDRFKHELKVFLASEISHKEKRKQLGQKTIRQQFN
ncbi:gamma carbonic anhydrase family protein (plasmid) [Coxiella burnetii]|uniref:gamma carbonic anhydrase family protein n=1 Tax=Coxiella burnetii TaxID=777 RepID=UPI000C05CA1C|nr:gamma carbonic anhydrase family protein [Coxiella burnetii]ATN73553.1 gamma carbonic anhydrase family protein [Coxiella burnetii]